MFQPCDYDVCADCERKVMAPSPQPIRRSPFQGNLASILLSPSRQPSAVVVQEQEPIHEPVASNLVPSNLPEVFQNSDALPGPKFFPIFVNHAPAPPMSHEMRFNAAAASPLRPPFRQTGRLRLRVSTPQQLLDAVTSSPRLRHRPRRQVEVQTPCSDCTNNVLLAALAITTPPRVGFPDFAPKNLFPDSPIPCNLIVSVDKSVGTDATLTVTSNTSVGTDVLVFCEAAVQTSPRSDQLPTSPRLDQPATLRDVRNELRALLVGLGF